jgi:hypothetical protein
MSSLLTLNLADSPGVMYDLQTRQAKFLRHTVIWREQIKSLRILGLATTHWGPPDTRLSEAALVNNSVNLDLSVLSLADDHDDTEWVEYDGEDSALWDAADMVDFVSGEDDEDYTSDN